MNDCIFCKIIKGAVPSETVHSEDDFIVIKDIDPKAPVHLLLLPKKHITSLAEVTEEDQNLLGRMLVAARTMAEKHSIDESGFKVLTNSGPDSNQDVLHLHFHLIGGAKLPGFV